MSASLRTRALSLIAAITILGAAGAATPALAAGSPPGLTRGSTYLALGDSVTFGYVEPQVVPAPNYHDAASFLGYPELIARELHVRAVNPACPGETSGSFVNTAAVSNGCENKVGKPGGYRVSYPLHVSYPRSQLAFAVAYLKAHHNVRLVSLMIGANDLFVCEETTADRCQSLDEQYAAVLKIQHNVRRILKAIRAVYGGQLAIVNYYSVDYASSAADGASMILNQAQDTAARPFHVVIADGFGELRAASRIFGGNTCAAGLLTAWGNPRTCGVHPSYAGQSLLAQALLKVVRIGSPGPPFTG